MLGEVDVRSLCQAAGKGDANAQFDLGYLYAVGRGVNRDEALAAAWFLKAARQKHPQARNWLSRFSVQFARSLVHDRVRFVLHIVVHAIVRFVVRVVHPVGSGVG